MSGSWKNKFIVYHLIALIFVKAVFSYSGLQFANLLDGVSIFSKEEIVDQTNTFRKTLGLDELKENPILDLAAVQKLEDMKYNNYFAHTSPGGISPWHWIDVNKYNYSYAGENLAIGFITAKDTVNAWVNSPTHKANLTNSKYQEIGVAVAPAKIENSEGFLVVQLFGTPKPTKTLATTTQTNKKITSPSPTVATNSPQPASTLTPTPKTASSPQLLPATTLVPAPISQTEKPGEDLKQIVSAIPVETNITSPTLAKFGDILNTSLILYALLAFIFSLVILIFRQINRGLVLRAVSAAVFLLLAVSVPLLEVTKVALIL